MVGVIVGCTLAAVVVLFILALVLNAVLVRGKRKTKKEPRVGATETENEVYARKLSRMIACKTVYTTDGKYAEEFKKFYEVLEENFPGLKAKAVKHSFNGALLYEIKGVNATKNVLLMSHHDVVLDEGEWEKPAFEGIMEDGIVYGRGTIDTKTPLFAELQATEELLNEGYEFNGINLYIASSNNEEVAGRGIDDVLAYVKAEKLRFDVVLDEGGAITEKMMPGVKEKSAMVAVHEKGRHRYVCTAEKLVKGHVGLNPTKDNPVERMSAFITEVKKSKIFKKKFESEVVGTFKTHAPYMPFALRLIMANFSLFKGVLKNVLGLVSPVVEAMLSTTLSFQKIVTEGDKVKVEAFFRCLREETFLEELKEFEKIAKKYGVSVEQTERDYCVPSSSDTPQFERLKKVLNRNFPDVIVSPFLLTAGTDARKLGDVSDCILRFAPIDLDSKQYASIHNPNEHIKIKNVGECVKFYKDFILSYELV